MTRLVRTSLAAAAVAAVYGCVPIDMPTLSQYIGTYFWLPAGQRPAVKKLDAPFAGMNQSSADPLGKLRAAYQAIADPSRPPENPQALADALAAARAQRLTPLEREEVDLIDAKIDLRLGSPDTPEPLQRSAEKLAKFLSKARNPGYRSEARGWLARVHYLLDHQAAAGRIYLDELKRSDRSLSDETLRQSLAMNYRWDRRQILEGEIGEYFDQPDHAAFAVKLLINPSYTAGEAWEGSYRDSMRRPLDGAKILDLMEQHRSLLRSPELALLSLRVALMSGDPAAAVRIAAEIPTEGAAIRKDPDFLWMLASSQFLLQHYAEAESLLLDQFRLAPKTDARKSSAAHGLRSIYTKTGNWRERLHYSLWLKDSGGLPVDTFGPPVDVFAEPPEFDFPLLLDVEAPLDALRQFLAAYPAEPGVRHAKYALAIRLAREDRYAESAALYESLQVPQRAQRMKQLAAISDRGHNASLPAAEQREALCQMAEILAAGNSATYWNDRLWTTASFQRYVKRCPTCAAARELRDFQEDRWRAFLIARDVAKAEGSTPLGQRAARVGIKALSGIQTSRFGRAAEVKAGIQELTKVLSGSSR